MPLTVPDILADPDLLLTATEDQWFERKGPAVAPRGVAKALSAFANAEGGILAVGVSRDRGLGGLRDHPKRANDARQAAVDLTDPTVRHSVHVVPCADARRDVDEVLVFEVEPSSRRHRLSDGSTWLRVGDETRQLDHEQAMELAFDRGDAGFEGEAARYATHDDLDLAAVERYRTTLGTRLSVPELLTARGLTPDRGPATGVSWAGLLLFGTYPTHDYPNAYVRVLRYEGTEARTGDRMNISHDEYVEGHIPAVIEGVQRVVPPLLRTITRLGPNVRFERFPEYPEFAWTEAVTNALTHRSYTLTGDHIRLSIFDDRLEVESPGRLPGLVRPDNIRTARYSRNPRIARVLAELGLVRELGEGVDRMFAAMADHGLPAPEFRQESASVRVTLRNNPREQRVEAVPATLPAHLAKLADAFLGGARLSTTEATAYMGLSRATTSRYLAQLRDLGLIERSGAGPRDPTAVWRLKSSLTDGPP